MTDTLIAFLLDRSGSMESVKGDVIGGFNSFLAEQRAVPGKCRFVFTQFDSQGVDTVDHKDIKDVPDLTPETYQPRSMTPLLDAIGTTMDRIDDLNVKTDRILFVIYTDGLENASREHTHDSVKKKVSDAQENYGWDFLFLGADIDAYAQSGAIGLARGQTVSVASANTSSTMGAMSATVTDYRGGDSYADSTKHVKAEEKRPRKKVSAKT